MTMSLERTHTQFLGQGQGLRVEGFGLLGSGWVGVSKDGAKLL